MSTSDTTFDTMIEKVDAFWKCQIPEASGGRAKPEPRGGSHLHLLAFDNFLVVVGRRGQPHVAERQLPLWLPAGVRWKGGGGTTQMGQ